MILGPKYQVHEDVNEIKARLVFVIKRGGDIDPFHLIYSINFPFFVEDKCL